MLALKTILHPTDFSPGSAYAFKLAASLARDHGAYLLVVHVVQPPAVAFGEAILDPTMEEVKTAAREALAKIQSPDGKVVLGTRLLEGDPAQQILQTAKDANADLIVMGTRSRGAIARLLMGSVAELVVRRADCPVLTVKHA